MWLGNNAPFADFSPMCLGVREPSDFQSAVRCVRFILVHFI